MTTTPTYNRAGITVDTIAANGLSASDAAQIQRSCGVTVVGVTYPGGNNVAVILPPGTDVGDLFEVYNLDSSQSIGLYCQSSESILGVASGNDVAISPLSMKQFRKISSTAWGSK